MGLGWWQGRTPDWDEISNMNWRPQLSKVNATLWGWDTRVLDTVEERVLVLDIFI